MAKARSDCVDKEIVVSGSARLARLEQQGEHQQKAWMTGRSLSEIDSAYPDLCKVLICNLAFFINENRRSRFKKQCINPLEFTKTDELSAEPSLALD